MAGEEVPDTVLEDQKRYYESRAAEYDEWFYRKERYDHGPEVNARWHADAAIVADVLADFSMTGDVLEFAPGTGIWTQRLLTTANTITAVDASPQMIEINRANLQSDKVHYIHADIFAWQPDRQYDGVFFGFWLSHVPIERLDAFFDTVAAALKPGGKLFFVDSRPDQTMSARNHKLPEAGSQIMKRILNDGSSFDIVKNFFDPADLTARCAKAGLTVNVNETPNYFIYAIGTRV